MKTIRNRGFTLFEVLVVIVIVAVLGLITFSISQRMIEKAKWTVDVSHMHQIRNGVVARAFENNDRAYTKDEIGKSNYREWKDPLSLCQVLKDYVGETAWLSPAANKRQKKFRNSYAWSTAKDLTSMTLTAIDLEKERKRQEKGTSSGTPLLWNAFNYTLPSVYNVPEATNGPSAASKQYHHRPWKRGTQINMMYLDGSIRTY